MNDYNHTTAIVRQTGLGSASGSPSAALSTEAIVGTMSTPLDAKIMARALPHMDDDDRKKYVDGDIKARKYSFYAIKPIKNKTVIDMFLPNDVRELGVTNFPSAVIPVNQKFFLEAIRILFADKISNADIPLVTTGADAAHFLKASFGTEYPDELTNGEFSLQIESDKFIEDAPMTLFRKTETQLVQAGVFVLETPRLLNSSSRIGFEIKLRDAIITKEAALKIELLGGLLK